MCVCIVHQYQACSMSSPPSDGPPFPASCCRLFHWISSSSTITVCCFLNRARVLWCFSANSYTQTHIILFNCWKIWYKILLLISTTDMCIMCTCLYFCKVLASRVSQASSVDFLLCRPDSLWTRSAGGRLAKLLNWATQGDTEKNLSVKIQVRVHIYRLLE